MPLTNVPTFTGDTHTGVYLGFKELQRQGDDGKPFTQYILGIEHEIPDGWGGTKTVIVELTVSQELQKKGFVTLLTPLVNSEVSFPVFIRASKSTGNITRYVMAEAMQMFGTSSQKDAA